MATLHSRPHGKHPEIHNEELFRIWQHFDLLKWQQRKILGRIPCALGKDHQLGALCSKRSTFSATSGDSVQLYYASLSSPRHICCSTGNRHILVECGTQFSIYPSQHVNCPETHQKFHWYTGNVWCVTWPLLPTCPYCFCPPCSPSG